MPELREKGKSEIKQVGIFDEEYRWTSRSAIKEGLRRLPCVGSHALYLELQVPHLLSSITQLFRKPRILRLELVVVAPESRVVTALQGK